MIRGLPFPRTKTIGDVYVDDLVILSVLHFSDVHCMSVRYPLKCSAPMLCTTSCRCQRVRASQSVLSRENSAKDAWTAFQERWGSLLHAESHSCSSRCWSLLLCPTPPTGLAALLERNLRAEPCEKLYATDASPCGAGGCVPSITREAWLALYELAEEKGEHVRLDWKGDEPPGSMRDGCAAAAPLALQLSWATLFSCRFSKASTSISWNERA